MGRSAARQSAEALLEQLRHEAKISSYEEIGIISDTLANATSILRRAYNSYSPLFKLPVEILHIILELVPNSYFRRESDFRPFWRNTLLDSSMLIPITHTCWRLREAALAHPRLWTAFNAPHKNANLSLIRQMTKWSKDVPLKAVGSDISILGELPPDTHFGLIHMYNIDRSGFRRLQRFLEKRSCPALRSFSLFTNRMNVFKLVPDNDTLLLTPEYAPNLHELTIQNGQALVDRGFPCLTRVALINVSARNFYARFISFIRECPQLESIFLSFMFDLKKEDLPNLPPALPLHSFYPDHLNHYVLMLQPRVQGSSLQILAFYAEDLTFPLSFLLPHHSDGPQLSTQMQLCIGVHPTNPRTESDYVISLTTITPHSTRRLAVWNHELTMDDVNIRPHEWPSVVFSQHTHPPPAVNEVWFYGADAMTFPRPPLLHLFGATRVVIGIDWRLHYDSGEPPSLLLLPVARDPHALSVTTLRFVYGFSSAPLDGPHESDEDPNPDSSSEADGHPSKFELSLGRLVQDLRSGNYGYIKHFVLQVTPDMRVDETKLAEVKAAGNFESFAFERIEEFPEMPGHSDPARWGCERYPGSLW